jgi:predicted aspartyl protease
MEKTKNIYERLLKAEAAEKKANAARIEIENEIFDQVKGKLTKTEGQESIEDQGFSITIRKSVSYKINEEKYRELCKTIPEELQIHSIKINLDKKKYDAVISIADKKYVKQIQDVVSMTPGKISVKVEKR